MLLWSTQSFFNGVSRVRTTLVINLMVAATNAIFNELLMFRLDMGMAGAAWATNLAQLIGIGVALWLMSTSASMRVAFSSHLTWRPRPRG